MQFTRSDQLDQVLQHEIALLMPQFFSQDKYGLITVTAVKTAKNFDSARVSVSCLRNAHNFAEDAKYKIFKIQQRLNQKLSMKIVPKIIFDLEGKTNLSDKLVELEYLLESSDQSKE